MQKLIQSRNSWLRTLLKVHTVALFVSLGVYFVFAFLDPGLLSYDMRQKFRALADETVVVMATVLSPPVQPVVTGVAHCDGTGVPSISLDWADDVNTYTYDIHRDGAPLVTGLTTSAFEDTVIIFGTTYQYVVTAYGPMGSGSATSDPISVTMPGGCTATVAAPIVTIVSFDGRGVDAYRGTPRSSNRRPTFTGTTTIPNALILITIGDTFLTQFTASSSGYWSWRPPYNVSSGSHTFTVTATDPGDSSRYATAHLSFDIRKNEQDNGGRVKKETSGKIPVSTEEVVSPLDFTLTVENQENSVLQGEILETTIHIVSLAKRYDHLMVPIRYSVTDENGGVLFSETKESYLVNQEEILHTLPIPMYTHPGKYFVQAEILLDTLNVSRRTYFSIQELPLIRLSSGANISYADIVRNLGWIVFAGIILFFLWFYLFIREFALYLKGDQAVTEYDLKKAGFFRG